MIYLVGKTALVSDISIWHLQSFAEEDLGMKNVRLCWDAIVPQVKIDEASAERAIKKGAVRADKKTEQHLAAIWQSAAKSHNKSKEN